VARETDTIRRATNLMLSDEVDITGHGNATVLAAGFANAFPKRAPRPHAVTLCG
jgi:hypothetical protein